MTREALALELISDWLSDEARVTRGQQLSYHEMEVCWE